jgi:hypothetical protein
MLKGDFTGKHFMFPPDWYGDLKVPRENPFSAAKVPTSSQSAEIHMPSSDIKLGEVPKSVSRQVSSHLSFSSSNAWVLIFSFSATSLQATQGR